MTEAQIKEQWAKDNPHIIWVSEIGISNHQNRVDILGFTKSFETIVGVEIKTQRDSLKRLPSQVRTMSELFDDCHLVVAPKHLEKAMQIVPTWWAVWVAEENTIKLFSPSAQRTFWFDGSVLAEQLWVNELRELLVKNGQWAESNMRKKELCRMAAKLPRQTLRTAWLTSEHLQKAVEAREI